ncbi:hypothetical protein [Streptomyces xanthophaeus]|uniref:Uncharacterized protein n=1 Tax=Streptomyces xanthophaeus TaxID=67385 RepID=A0A919LDF0_9ACTN|nr:hypothetical protein [Streptomyces xanthophaeus]GHI87035.1 hypothetical protein Sxan_43990 [Streptomyces xanthophaeus]
MRRLLIPVALAVGVLWWWAVLRLVLAPAESGAVEGAVAVGGWGLGLLPVHCVPGPVRRARRPADAAAGAGELSGAQAADAGTTRASTLRHSGEGSDPS